MELLLEIEVNAEGDKLAYLFNMSNEEGQRIAGPKAWGGSRNIARFEFSADNLITFIKECAPAIIPLLTESPQ